MTDPVCISGPLTVLAVHASAVYANGGALIFLGPSGAGKSTLCRLLGTRTPTLADDAVYLIPQADAQWSVAKADLRVYSGPLPPHKVALLKGVPLRAIFRLRQAAQPDLRRLQPLEVCQHLTAAFFEVHWPRFCDVETKRKAFADLAAIARSTPGYDLYFNRSSQTAELLKVVGFW